ncbi:MAG: tRNA pseudouridine synthase A [Micrococcaceae bacterium]|uniref:tRNA pseudouridine synthase A n=1 Tax=Arthrobacter sp. 179 TaxID=3457734 RepID=UPI002654502A|nr:tRNA pseudouridine synthase A [Micrococcaceae bacterium]
MDFPFDGPGGRAPGAGSTADGANTSEPATVRILLRLAYDGSGFSGWATQPGRRTVQGSLEEALGLLFRRPVRTTVAGRTDAGVHARGQVAHFDLTEAEYRALPRGKNLSEDEALLRRLRGVTSRIGGEVFVHEARAAAVGFDARFSALWRRYSYRIADGQHRWDPLTRSMTLWHPRELDPGLLNTEAQVALGRHDFLSYCRPKNFATTIRTLEAFTFTRAEDGTLVASLQADAFCHNMVRTLIGAVLRVGDGEEAPGWVERRIAEPIRDHRTRMAAPHPLVLEQVAYPEDDQLGLRAETTRARRRPEDLQRS